MPIKDIDIMNSIDCDQQLGLVKSALPKRNKKFPKTLKKTDDGMMTSKHASSRQGYNNTNSLIESNPILLSQKVNHPSKSRNVHTYLVIDSCPQLNYESNKTSLIALSSKSIQSNKTQPSSSKSTSNKKIKPASSKSVTKPSVCHTTNSNSADARYVKYIPVVEVSNRNMNRFHNKPSNLTNSSSFGTAPRFMYNNIDISPRSSYDFMAQSNCNSLKSKSQNNNHIRSSINSNGDNMYIYKIEHDPESIIKRPKKSSKKIQHR